MDRDGLRIGRPDQFDLCSSLSEKRLRFAARNQPGMQISSATRVDPLERVARSIPLVEFNCQVRRANGKAMRHHATAILWNNQSNAAYCSTQIAIADTIQPKQCKCEAVVYRVLGFAIRHSQKRLVARAAF
jgi:hypothetical protein